MKQLFKTTGLLFVGFSFALLTACNSETNGGEGENAAEDQVMTTDEFIKEANDLGSEKFMEKYPNDTEITLKGEVRAPATWDDKVAAKFGTGLNDLPLTADFMFTDNGGTKESTKEKVTVGAEIVFTGKMDGCFFTDNKLNRCTLKECVAK